MSIRQILVDNDLKLYVNTTDRGVNLNGTIITSSGTNYKFILPVNTPDNINSILAVASIVDDNILLHWIAPTGGPIIPIDTINCNILNAAISVNTVQLEVNNNMTGGSVKFIMDSPNDSTYILPDNVPTEQSILTSDQSGVMTWQSIPSITIPNFYLFDIIGPSNILELDAGQIRSYNMVINNIPQVDDIWYQVSMHVRGFRSNGTTFTIQLGNVVSFSVAVASIDQKLVYVSTSDIDVEQLIFYVRPINLTTFTLTASFQSNATAGGRYTIDKCTYSVFPAGKIP